MPFSQQKPGMVLHSLRTKSDTDAGKAAAASIPVLTKPTPEPERNPSPFVPKSRPASGRNLSTRQQKILDLIRECYDRGDFPPSIRDIGTHVGLSSSSTVHSHLKSLEQKGYIKRDPSKPRAITILNYSPHVQEAARLRSILEKIAQHWDDPATAKSILQEALGPDHPVWGEA